MGFLLHEAAGSEIFFNSSSSFVKPLVTTNLTLTCKLQDTMVGPAIGKRSVPRYHNVISGGEGQAGMADDLEDDTMSPKSVTQTAENMPFVTSIIISRNGVDLASISDHFPARPHISDVTVSGHLFSGQGERGLLQITWTHPTQEAAGNYLCDVSTLSAQGHVIAFSQTVNVAEAGVTMGDLVREFHQLKVEKELMQKTIDDQAGIIHDMNNTNIAMNKAIDDQTSMVHYMKKTVAEQANTIHGMRNESVIMNKTIADQANIIQDVKKTVSDQAIIIHYMNSTDQRINQKMETIIQSDAAMNQSLTSLRNKARVEPNIVFSAIRSTSTHLSRREVLVYDKVVTNEGSCYSHRTGIFTSPLDGFYHFEIHAFSYKGSYVRLELQHNSGRVISVIVDDRTDRHGASNSVTIKLSRRDQVKVVCYSSAKIYSSVIEFPNTFSGHLLSLL